MDSLVESILIGKVGYLELQTALNDGIDVVFTNGTTTITLTQKHKHVACVGVDSSVHHTKHYSRNNVLKDEYTNKSIIHPSTLCYVLGKRLSKIQVEVKAGHVIEAASKQYIDLVERLLHSLFQNDVEVLDIVRSIIHRLTPNARDNRTEPELIEEACNLLRKEVDGTNLSNMVMRSWGHV